MAETHRTTSYVPLLRSYPDSEKLNSVSEQAEVLYLRLHAVADDADNYWADPAVIVRKLFTFRPEVKHSDVEKRLAELEQAELIEIYAVNGRQYLHLVDRFVKRRKDVKPKYLVPQRLAESGPDTGRTRDESGTDTGRTRNGHVPPSVSVSVDTKDSCSPDGERTSQPNEYTAEFTDWWTLYPRKKGKRKAFAEFKRAKKRVGVAKLMETVRLFASRVVDTDPQYVVYPERWLSRGMYDDEDDSAEDDHGLQRLS